MKRLLLSLVFLLLAFSCRPHADSNLQSIVSESEVEKRIRLLLSKKGSQAVCDDVKLALSMINDIYEKSYAIDCGQSTKDQLAKLFETIQDLGDLHAKVEFGFQLDLPASAAIAACDGLEECPNLLGSGFEPIVTPSGRLYGIIHSSKSDGMYFLAEILTVNQKNPREFAMNGAYLFSHNSSVQMKNDAYALLRRFAFDRRSKEDLSFRLRRVNDDQEFGIKTSHQQRKSHGFDDKSLEINSLVKLWPFACVERFKSGFIDACLDSEQDVIISVGAWLEPDASPAEVRSTDYADLENLLAWLGQHPREKRIILDLRGNTGGSSELALRFLCAFDSEITRDKMQKLSYRIMRPLAHYTLEGQAVALDSLIALTNSDLFNPRATHEEKTYSKTLAERFPFACEGHNALESRQMVVLTDGTEFSTTELFLHIAKSMDMRVKVLGNASRGGSGNPLYITLPKTGFLLRLSIARLFEDGAMIIEGRGVKPHLELNIKSDPGIFEQRVTALLQGLPIPQDSQYRAELRQRIDEGFGLLSPVNSEEQQRNERTND